MNFRIFITILGMLAGLVGYSQKFKTNVLSYYAVNNSIDGQPKINQLNVLRFYPVFAFRQNTESVVVTVYYGGEVYRRNAIPSPDKLYWQVKLPDFDLGMSIQRYEVEASVKLTSAQQFQSLQESYKLKYDKAINALSDTRNIIDSSKVSSRIKEINSCLLELNAATAQLINETDKIAQKTNSFLVLDDNNLFLQKIDAFYNNEDLNAEKLINEPHRINNLGLKLNDLNTSWITENQYDKTKTLTNFDQKLKDLKSKHEASIKELDSISQLTQCVDSSGILDSCKIELTKKVIGTIRSDWNASKSALIQSYNEMLTSLWKEIAEDVKAEIKDKTEKTNSQFSQNQIYITELSKELAKVEKLDSLLKKSYEQFVKSNLAVQDTVKESLLEELINKDFTGIGVQKSDIVLSENLERARILYRNYKLTNRELPALDPAEELGVFRLRYIPFPIVGGELVGPAREGIPMVFEAGITFGNRTVVSNEVFDPSFSIRRLGVAIAFTPKLFSEDAELLALALTYDFNTYASIGVGANFGTLSSNNAEPYFSLGINQKIFQALVSGLQNIVK